MDYIKQPIFLGPMAGNADYGFRRICHECGADVTVTEMVSAKAVFFHDKKTEHIALIRPDERPCVLQIFGSDGDCLANAARELGERYQPEGIDINMGCPAPKIFNNGDGSALLGDLLRAEEIVRTVRKATDLPLSVKFRLGIAPDKNVAVEAAKRFESAGADYIAVHGRFREQFYSGSADWDSIAAVKRAVCIPVIANGDIDSPEQYKAVLERTGADGVMVARGALGDPHLFTRLQAFKKDGTILPRPDLKERLNLAVRQLDYTIEDKGETLAVREMRKHLIWYVKGIRNALSYKLKCSTVCTRDDCIQLINLILQETERP